MKRKKRFPNMHSLQADASMDSNIYIKQLNTMLKALILLLIPFLAWSQEQKILTQDYSFLVIDGEVTKLHQSQDTLYEMECFIGRPCEPKQGKHYKIISAEKKGEYTILKLERLDKIPLTTDPYPSARYSVLALKAIDNSQLGYLPLARGLIREQLDTVNADIKILKEEFFFTFYSDTYLKELSTLKKITTKVEAEEIIAVIKSDQFKPLAESYSKAKAWDMYGSGFSAELLNKACIEKGYNPVGAGSAVESLMK